MERDFLSACTKALLTYTRAREKKRFSCIKNGDIVIVSE